MKRTTADGHVANKFSDGDPATGAPATVLESTMTNAFQEEIAVAIEQAGIALDGLSTGQQLYKAIQAFVQVGGGAPGGTTLALANNQVAAANLAGLIYDKATTYGVRLLCHLSRRTATPGSEVVAIGELRARYLPSADSWDLHDEWQGDEAHGVTFSITNTGQIQYVSSNIAGSTYVGELRVTDVKLIKA